MRLMTWNVAGWRACVKKGFNDAVDDLKPDIIMLQETKVQAHQIQFKWDSDYTLFLNPAEKAGYSGTALLTKVKPLEVINRFFDDREGRVVIAEFTEYYVIGVYVPNSKEGLLRLPYRMEWDNFTRKILSALDKQKPVIWCGDLNVAHEEIDLKYPHNNHFSAGFSDEERGSFSETLALGFKDAFRALYPNKVEYSFWTNFGQARANNSGWRLDYFVVSDRFMPRVVNVTHHRTILGSDHCPVTMDIL